MPTEPASQPVCRLCGTHHDLVPTDVVRAPILDLIRRDHPDWPAAGWICRHDLDHYRALHVQALLEEEKGELTTLERQVVEGLREQDIVSANTNLEFARRLTLGEKLADKIATFGGSWTFILSFMSVLVVWIAVNVLVLRGREFDPYPFILLNLVLSCIAALQAPVIMMSQNRQEAKDRLRAEHDYRVNLKAELEIRLLSERVDRLLTHQWQRLLEIQRVQVELLDQASASRRGEPPEAP